MNIKGLTEEDYNEFIGMIKGTPIMKNTLDWMLLETVNEHDLEKLRTSIYTFAFVFWMNGRRWISNDNSKE